MKPDIALIGCGKMGGALLRGWIKSNIADNIFVVEPAGLPDDLRATPSVRLISSTANLPHVAMIVLAVKPQIMNDICAALTKTLDTTALILSIAAGQTIANFEKHFSADQPIIRAMPNTPAAIGKGATVAVANARVGADQQKLADDALRATGLVEWIKDEELMDAVTALSGSGPAYLFYLIEVMAEAGVQAGLPRALSETLARQTVIGAAALAENEPQTSAGSLRENVTSPGGTTAAALHVLRDSGEMQDLFNRALLAATKRGKELRG